jgi:uncharacterized protein YbcI
MKDSPMNSMVSRAMKSSVRDPAPERGLHVCVTAPGAIPERVSRTRGEVEALICEGMIRFKRESLGRGPKHIRAHFMGDLLVVRLTGVLTLAETQLLSPKDSGKGHELVKQVRMQLVETARPFVTAMVEEVAGVNVIALLSDIDIESDEEFVIFTLADAPAFRDAIRR